MKYIRTNAGRIYEIAGKERRINGNYITISGWKIYFFDVSIESDRLEDLFDEQIVEYKDKSGKIIKSEFVNHIYDGEIPEGEREYYGAVRTTAGLHYVAKKIEGEWRLI